MASISTTKLSSRGQVVIPREVRRRLGLEPGAEFVVLGEGDVVILKAIRPPSMSDFDATLRRARQEAKAAGLKRSDVARAVAEARKAE